MNTLKRIERCEFHVMLIAVVMLVFVTGIKSVDAQEEQEESVSRYSPGDVFRDCVQCPEMVVVPAGTFNMGSNASEEV